MAMNLPPLVESLASLPWNDWEAIIASDPAALSSGFDPVRGADIGAGTLAMVSGYCDARRQGLDHDAAIEHGRKRTKAVRKALGYTNP